MKFLGITLFWVGMIMLLKNVGLVQEVDSGLVWAVVLIILGTTLKHGCRYHGMCGMMMKGKGGMCGEGHKCMGAGCPECGNK